MMSHVDIMNILRVTPIISCFNSESHILRQLIVGQLSCEDFECQVMVCNDSLSATAIKQESVTKSSYRA